MKKYFLFSAVCLLFVCTPVLARENRSPVDPAQLFVKANAAYAKADFDAAAKNYEKIISAGIGNGEIYYNLGNAYLKAGHIGRAILNYRKAELLMPRDEDLQANLKYAGEQSRDNIVCNEALTFLGDFCFWYTKLNRYELLYLFIGVNFLFWALLAVRLFYRAEGLNILFYIVGLMLLVIGPSAGLKIYRQAFVKKGVVVEREIMVRSGSTVNATVLFKLHDGAEFFWQEDKAGWVKIRLCDGKKGWVRRKMVDRVDLAVPAVRFQREKISNSS